MTTQEYSNQVEAAAEMILKAQGTSLRNYTESTREEILDAVRLVMSNSYIRGSNATVRILDGQLEGANGN